jgi:hypothetical protein
MHETKPCGRAAHVGVRELPANSEYFYANAISKDGLHNWCKTCCKVAARENTLKHKRARQAGQFGVQA